MAQSTDPGHFFQTSSSLTETNRKSLKSTNTHGAPIRLASKLLAVTADPFSPSHIYIAESAGLIRRLDFSTGESTHVYRGPQAPVTSIAICGPAAGTADAANKENTTKNGLLVLGGCWDKDVWSWDATSKAVARKYKGHTDFVKAVLVVSVAYAHSEEGPTGTSAGRGRARRELLLSAGADAVIIVWDLRGGDKLHVLRGHARGVQSLVLDPYSPPSDGERGVTVFSAGSEKEIRRWKVSADAADEVEPRAERLLAAHETSVYGFEFDASGDLWTASADKTAKCLSRERGWETDTELLHPDFVRDVAVSEEMGMVVTACRDEEVRVWDRGTGKLKHVWRGHWEEVTGLCLVSRGREVVSVSLDGTVRRWGLEGGVIEEAKVRERRDEEDRLNGVEKDTVGEEKGVSLTEEEERELAELMDE